MKTGQVILIGGTLAAILFRKQLGELVNKGVTTIEEKTKNYLGKKINFSPKGLPRISVDFKRAAVKLNGSIELINRTDLAATLDTYKIDLILGSAEKSIILGSTPIQYPAKEVQANSTQEINYTFIIKLDAIAKLAQSKNIQDSNLILYVNSLKISGINAPSLKFDISNSWQDIVKSVNNPASLLTNLFKL